MNRVKVKIINRTELRKIDLRRIAVRAVRQIEDLIEGSKFDLWGPLRIEFREAAPRGDKCWGRAHIGGRSCWVNAYAPFNHYRQRGGRPRTLDDSDKIELAHIIAHEVAHCAGMEHSDMKECYRELTWGGNWDTKFEWAAAMPLGFIEPRKRVQKTGLALAEERHARAIAKVKEWESKKRRAAKLEKKWRDKIRYYERRMAALRPGGADE
jgi:hypothetical protein